ncbi:vesicle-associated membrane protein 8-like [Antedon mediterranea]|uniref:vesicle-associated membrane protein 8-like n=1 Tax=Antedon mediterranea TaxID=105859 RepID=UPI003AF9E7E5
MSSDKTKQLQKDVDQVTDIMQENIEKILERGDKLDDLSKHADDLEQNSAGFKKTAVKVRKKMWWKNTKYMILLTVIVLLIILIIVLAAWRPWK